MTQVGTLFGSFNARNLAPEQVAQTFVPPDYFRTLVGQHHTLIVGPRGSGKTTLLKMLQPEALDAWAESEAALVRSELTYSSVYIATDISWGRQVDLLDAHDNGSSLGPTLGVASFTSQTLRNLVGTMEYLVRARSDSMLTDSKEAFVAAELSKTFALPSHSSTLLGVKYELSRRLSQIHAISKRESVLGHTGRVDRLTSEQFLDLDFRLCCSAAIDVYNDAVGRPHARWALLFDELELAPKAIRDHLLTSLRSVDERLLFKLSLVPYGQELMAFYERFQAMPGHDFEIIPLWYSHKEEGRPFCHRLWYSMLRSRNLPATTPEDVLGHSVFDTVATEWKEGGTAYRGNTRVAKRFRRLASKDKSFATFLSERAIDVERLDRLASDERAATVRKATSIVAVRDAFISESGDQPMKPSLRSRKATDLYTGSDSVFAITEGNPRWFIGIVGPMLDSLEPNAMTVSQETQNRSIVRAMSRFRALLRTIPCPPWHGGQAPRGVLRLLDAIGDRFFNELVAAPFNLDPPGTVTIDSRANDELMESLGEALNAGALVSMEVFETPWPNLRGKRLRLAYLLAAYYRLTLRVERPISLRRILEGERPEEGPTLFDAIAVDEDSDI